MTGTPIARSGRLSGEVRQCRSQQAQHEDEETARPRLQGFTACCEPHRGAGQRRADWHPLRTKRTKHGLHRTSVFCLTFSTTLALKARRQNL